MRVSPLAKGISECLLGSWCSAAPKPANSMFMLQMHIRHELVTGVVPDEAE